MLNLKLIYCLLCIVSCLLIQSCSPERKLRKLLRKHPELLTTDTIFYSDTIISPSLKVDTAIYIDFDTVVLEKAKLSIQLIRINDTIYLNGEVKSDTIIKEIPIQINSVNSSKKTPFAYIGFLGWVLIFFLLIILVLVLRRAN